MSSSARMINVLSVLPVTMLQHARGVGVGVGSVGVDVGVRVGVGPVGVPSGNDAVWSGAVGVGVRVGVAVFTAGVGVGVVWHVSQNSTASDAASTFSLTAFAASL